MSSTGIDRVVKNTLRLSLLLVAVVAQRTRSCHELPLGSASEYCDRGVQATGGWMARSCTWDATSPVTTPRERRRGATSS